MISIILSTTYNIKIEVLKVNGQADTIHTNNIATKALKPGISGIYTISQTSGDFSSFGSAINYIQNNSICGAVTFKIDSGFYNEQISIPEIIGASSTNTITFKGITNNNSDVVLSYDANQWYANYTLKITGKHIRFENITLETKASSSHLRTPKRGRLQRNLRSGSRKGKVSKQSDGV